MDQNSNNKFALPWAITVDEFRKSGNFSNWTDEAVQQAIETLVEMTIIAINTIQLEQKK
jgi:hypothetical protein